MDNKIFTAYSDESGCFDKRYQAIGVVSGEKIILSELRSELKDILSDKKGKEVKFAKVKTHRPMIDAAHKFIEEAVEFAKQRKIRIDVLVWDTHDSRHDTMRRDDVKNLKLMYYKVLRHIFEKWRQINWEVYPDEGSKFNWQEIINYLHKTQTPRRKPNLLTLFDLQSYAFNPKKIKQIKSHEEPLIQIGDLFAGMARFSREKGKECVEWLEFQKRKKDHLLFQELTEKKDEKSETNCNRFILIGMLSDLCKKYRLGVSLYTRKYLCTQNPLNPINFWNYETQHPDDKAPTKKRKFIK